MTLIWIKTIKIYKISKVQYLFLLNIKLKESQFNDIKNKIDFVNN